MLKILVIDDEKELVELYRDILSSKNRKIVTSSSGDGGIKLLQQEHFDLVLSDKKMGKVSGLEVLDFVESNSPTTVFFLITGDSSKEINFKNEKSKLIRKPFSFQELNKIIVKLEH